ncbi:histidine permease [Pseudomassariella vexata]|uniref:Histidine permease n=1 Tax=Pseudomassariella vexata TaxID=1141098 RepID=A0A1Y2E502_9PEZI|nr:histidine permease [Pseudomassariella vexata]ORY66609.1 histidine permease [Pseudomassariella vexata]
MASDHESRSGAESATEKNSATTGTITSNNGENHLKRHLGNRQIQLMAMGASIGTSLFVGIGTGLTAGGPGSLLLAFAVYSCILAPINNCAAEMIVYMPVPGSFMRMAGKWVDPALGFMAGWNFFLYESILIPFEVSALSAVLTTWNENIPVWAPCLVCMVAWGFLNLVAVEHFGNAEFVLSGFKILLILVVFVFTFVVMVGGNPKHDAFGFRYWDDPGAFAPHITEGTLGQFYGFIHCLRLASLTIVGSEYISILAPEAERPRTYLKTAFKTIYWRFLLLFMGCALSIGILIPWNDAIMNSSAASPFVLAMNNLKIDVLPHLINALMAAAIFSAGNGYVFCSSRSLHCLALEGHAPKFLSKCNKQGIPYYAFGVTMLFPMLSLLQVVKSQNAGKLVVMLGDVTATAQLINYFVMSTTYICFYRAMKRQGIDRSTLPYVGWMQPFCGYVGAVSMVLIAIMYGYTLFIPGQFRVMDFFICYTVPILGVLIFTAYKFKIKRTHMVSADEADLVWEKPAIDAYEDSLVTPPSRLADELMALVGRRMRRNSSVEHIFVWYDRKYPQGGW